MARWLNPLFAFFFVIFLFSIPKESSFLVFNFPQAKAQTSLTVSMTVGDTTLLISGQTSPEALVTFVENGATIGTTSAFANGFFSKRFTAQTPGIHTFGIYAKDQSGVTSATVTSSLSLTAKAETALANLILPPTISLDKSTATQGTIVIISGRTAPSSTVAIFIFETRIASVTASSANGAWSYSLDTSSISLGDQSVYAKTTTSEGYQSQTSQTLTLKINPPTTVTTTPTPTAEAPAFAALPAPLRRLLSAFDPDGSGRIEVREVFVAVKAWVEEWRQVLTEEIKALAEGAAPTPEAEKKCDLNADGRCNLLDFSVLLFYIER